MTTRATQLWFDGIATIFHIETAYEEGHDLTQRDAAANAGSESRLHSTVTGPAWLRFTLGCGQDMNLKRQLRISKGIWAAISIPLFIAAWFLRGGKGGDEPAWEIWRVFLTHDYICSEGEMLMALGIYTLAFAALALLAGWLLQFPICVALDYFRGVRSKHENDKAQPGACT